jgi:hypothetical protein
LIRLNPIGQVNDTHGGVGPELRGDSGAASVARGVAIQHQDHTLEPMQQHALLRLV